MPIPSVETWNLAVLKAANETPVNGLPDGDWIRFVADLLTTYHAQSSTKTQKANAATYLYYAAVRWKKKAGSTYKSGPESGTTRMGKTQALENAVNELYEAARDHVRAAFLLDEDEHTTDEKLFAFLAETIGAPNQYLEDDKKKHQELKLAYLTQDTDRINYKIRFRGGLAYRVADLLATDEREWVKYDSFTSKEAEHPDNKPGFVHYAMDYRGRLYVGFRKNVAFFHSSLVGGEHALSAGTLAIKEGKIVQIDLDSGHYTPKPKHLALALVHLRLHGVDLSTVTVKPFQGNFRPAREFLGGELGSTVN